MRGVIVRKCSQLQRLSATGASSVASKVAPCRFQTTTTAVTRVVAVSQSQVESHDGMSWAVAACASLLTLAATQKAGCEEVEQTNQDQISREDQEPVIGGDTIETLPGKVTEVEETPKERNGLGVYDWYKENIKKDDESSKQEEAVEANVEQVVPKARKQYTQRCRAQEGEKMLQTYQNNLRDYAEDKKAFTFFATVKVGDKIYMRPQDFVRYLTRGEMQPKAYDDFDKFHSLDPATMPVTTTPSTERLFQVKADGSFEETDILISFSDFSFLKMLLTSSADRYMNAFRLVDLDGNGEICRTEFAGISKSFNVDDEEFAKSHISRRMFGDDGQGTINAEGFQSFVAELQNQITKANFLDQLHSKIDYKAVAEAMQDLDQDTQEETFVECISKVGWFRVLPGEAQGLGFTEALACYNSAKLKKLREIAAKSDEAAATDTNTDTDTDTDTDTNTDADTDTENRGKEGTSSTPSSSTSSPSSSSSSSPSSSSIFDMDTVVPVGVGSMVGALAGTTETFVLGAIVGFGVSKVINIIGGRGRGGETTTGTDTNNTSSNNNNNTTTTTTNADTTKAKRIKSDLPLMNKIQLCKSLMRQARIPTKDRIVYYARIQSKFGFEGHCEPDITFEEYSNVLQFSQNADNVNAALLLLYAMQKTADETSSARMDLMRISHAIDYGGDELDYSTVDLICTMLGIEDDDKLYPVVDLLQRCSSIDKLKDKQGLIQVIQHQWGRLAIALNMKK